MKDASEQLARGGPRCPLGPGDPPPYGDTQCGPAYWDARHAAAGDDPFDWYMDYSRLSEVLNARLPPQEDEPEILDVGCGTSELAACLYADGWKNVIGVDTSVVAITRARGARRHVGRHELQFLQMDACQLEFPDSCFHAIIDKALFDTLVTGGHAFPRGRALLSEVHRVLRPGGVFFLVSHASVGARLPWLALDASWMWRVEVARLTKPFPACLGEEHAVQGNSASDFFYVYICTKPTQEVLRRVRQGGSSVQAGVTDGDDETGHRSVGQRSAALSDTSNAKSSSRRNSLGAASAGLEAADADAAIADA